MKTLKIAIAFLFLVGLSFTACQRNDGDTIVSPNYSSNGNLSFKARDVNNANVSGITVRLYISASDLSNGASLKSKTTGNNGVANFGSLNSGNYYFSAEDGILGSYYEEGVVQVRAGFDTMQELTVQ